MDPKRRSRVFRLLGLCSVSQHGSYSNSIVFVLHCKMTSLQELTVQLTVQLTVRNYAKGLYS